MPATVPSRHLQTPAQGGFKNVRRLHEASYQIHLKQASKRSSFKHGRCVTVHGGFKKHIQNYKMIVEGLSANKSSQFYVILEVSFSAFTYSHSLQSFTNIYHGKQAKCSNRCRIIPQVNDVLQLYKTLCITLDDIIWKPPDASARNRATKSKSKRR
ncbi:unnamed protein product [Brassica oleracea var. botrytis]|uniref:Uncharacterized protein n=3 Tax=Brassica TaxID=3705 RepID=A0A0D3EH28_BRAOL|nr:hypothetical protein HID58_089621 [Brassica napus]CAF1789013.1 unnamed protein product [Brassica napus]VDD34352.1 unnamed protein product [Brassica oleracea]